MMDTVTRDSETGLSPVEARALCRVAGIMIPASAAYRMPSADDPLIFADIVRSIGRDLPDLREALVALGDGFADMNNAQAEAVAEAVLARGDRAVAALGRVVLQCYYRDDRVLVALGLEARAPFPKGYTVEQVDWSLLDAVRDRPALWRDDRGTRNGQ